MTTHRSRELRPSDVDDAARAQTSSGAGVPTPLEVDIHLAELRRRHELLQVVSSSIAELLTAGSLKECLPLALKKIATAVSIDRMLVVEVKYRAGMPPLSVPFYVWHADTGPATQDPGSIQPKDAAELAALLEWKKPLQEAKSVFASQRTGPPELAGFLQRRNMFSILLVPIMIQGRHWGQIGFDDCTNERDWTEDEIGSLKLLADVIGVTITRERYIADLANANTIIQNSPNVLYRLRGEPSFRLMYVSQNVTVFGYNPDDLISAPTLYHSYVHAEDRPRIQAAMAGLLGGNAQPLTLEFRMLNGSGESRWVENRYTPVHDADGCLVEVEGIMVDVTERKRAEQRAATGERLESIGRLAAGVAHEINTPIQFLNDSVSFISEGVHDLLADNEKLRAAMPVAPPPDENIEELKVELPPALDRVVDGLERIAEIVRSMKEFSHADQREKSQVDLNRAISSTLVIARSEYKYVAEVETDFQELPLITCHGGQINQVVLNLVVNAAHAIAGTVKGTTNKGLITVKTCIEAGCAVVSISDTGGGIPESIRKRIFEPFFTTKEVGKGTGQGLSIAHNVITSHGGTLDFVTEFGKGTTFYVRLPLRAEGSEAAVV